MHNIDDNNNDSQFNVYGSFHFSIYIFPDTTDIAGDDVPVEEQPSVPQLPAPPEARDLLTCGQCSQAFPLAHILAFIQHKQGGCLSKTQTLNVSNAPPSPANRATQQKVKCDPGPGFIELRRGAIGSEAWGEEPSVRVKAEPGKTGECMKQQLVNYCLCF